ncbi:MAG: hypothetical protein CM1200mP5_6880 [Candidatus Pelagibacterales bacterium]|nr:MAG: hypothetical protein CM1200mP5_6880 [Pelagibacterales bacterium]
MPSVLKPEYRPIITTFALEGKLDIIYIYRIPNKRAKILKVFFLLLIIIYKKNTL